MRTHTCFISFEGHTYSTSKKHRACQQVNYESRCWLEPMSVALGPVARLANSIRLVQESERRQGVCQRGAAEDIDSWNAKSSWETHNKSGVSEHDGSHSEWKSWDNGRQSGVAQHDDRWDGKNSWDTRRQSGASEHDDAGYHVPMQ